MHQLAPSEERQGPLKTLKTTLKPPKNPEQARPNPEQARQGPLKPLENTLVTPQKP
jgi:hypothetical protein